MLPTARRRTACIGSLPDSEGADRVDPGLQEPVPVRLLGLAVLHGFPVCLPSDSIALELIEPDVTAVEREVPPTAVGSGAAVGAGPAVGSTVTVGCDICSVAVGAAVGFAGSLVAGAAVWPPQPARTSASNSISVPGIQWRFMVYRLQAPLWYTPLFLASGIRSD